MDYPGLDVISVDNQLSSNAAICVVGVLILIAAITVIEMNNGKFASERRVRRQTAACIAGIAGIIAVIIGILPIHHSGQLAITATISDGATFSDITRRYEIVSNYGDVYTLKRKNETDSRHYVCEKCGLEIESGPPWLCRKCRETK